MPRSEGRTERRGFDGSTRWEVRRLKTVADLRTSNVDKNSYADEQPVRLCNYTDVYYSSQIDDPSGFMKATATPEEIRRFRLRQGDVLITKDSESADDIAVPAHVARDFEDVVCGYHLAILPRAMNSSGSSSTTHCSRIAYVISSRLARTASRGSG